MFYFMSTGTTKRRRQSTIIDIQTQTKKTQLEAIHLYELSRLRLM